MNIPSNTLDTSRLRCPVLEDGAEVMAAAQGLVASVDADLLDAAWIACGALPLAQWAPETQAALPAHPSGKPRNPL